MKLPLIALAALLALGMVSPRADAQPQAHPVGNHAPMVGRVHNGANGGVRLRPRNIWVYPGDAVDYPSYGWWCANPAGWYPSVAQCFDDWRSVPLY